MTLTVTYTFSYLYSYSVLLTVWLKVMALYARPVLGPAYHGKNTLNTYLVTLQAEKHSLPAMM